MRLTDEAGVRSDTFEMRLDDRAPHIAFPRTSVELEVAMGYAGQVQPMGLFVVDEVKLGGPPDELEVRARGANLTGRGTGPGKSEALKGVRTRSFDAITLGELVQLVASNAGWAANVSPALAGVALGHVDQVAESDWHLLTRLAVAHGATIKAAGGVVVVVPENSTTSASGTPLPAIEVAAGQVRRWSFVHNERTAYARVRAGYCDKEAAACLVVEVGATEGPALELRRQYADQDAAMAAAEAAFNRSQCSSEKLRLELVGDARIGTGTPLELAGLRSELNGLWRVKRADHRIDRSGFVTSVELTRCVA
jgi:phage protein D